MTALEIFAILVLAGAVIVLLYYFMKEITRTGNTGFDTLKSSVSNMGKDVSGAGNRVSQGISHQYNGGTVEGESKNPGVSERVSEMGDKLKGKVKEVPISTDVLSTRIDEFLNAQSDRLIKDWELATKSDVNGLEKKYSKVTRDIDDLGRRFSEYKGHVDKKFEHIDNRLTALEGEEET